MNNLNRGYGLILNTKLGNITRQVQTNASLLENCIELKNRNPRNLELMRIARKPVGYHLDKAGKEFWNKLYITVTSKHIEAGVTHFKNGPVVTATTKEWALKKQLYKTKDVAAFSNVGRLLAQRCLECGITSVRCNIDATNSARHSAFLDELKKGGVDLEEPQRYNHAAPWDKNRMIKPWTVVE